MAWEFFTDNYTAFNGAIEPLQTDLTDILLQRLHLLAAIQM
jgi:hypothetical protein